MFLMKNIEQILVKKIDKSIQAKIYLNSNHEVEKDEVEKTSVTVSQKTLERFIKKADLIK